MRLTTYLLMTLVCAWALPALGQEAGGQPRPPSAPDSPALDQPPPEPPPPPPPTPRPEPGIPGGPRPPEPDGVAPPPTPRPSAPRIDPLLRLIAERRPELAERLERLRRESPARFREVVLDALTARLEEALNEVESQPERPLGLPGDGQGGRGGGGRAGPPALRERGPAGPPELRAHVRELEEQQGQLERQTQELAQKLQERRSTGAPNEERDRMREELVGLVKQQFEVRTELRKAELQRIEHELQRIREMVENLQRELAHREQEREAIIQKRIDQLLGQDANGW